MTTNEMILIGAGVLLALVVLLLVLRRRGAPDQIAVEPGAATIASPEALPEAPEAIEPLPGPAGPPDPLTTLKGLGPKAAARLGELGITRYDQLGALTDAQAARIDAEMGAFKGRIARDRWIEQARLLAADDRAGFEAVFGKLG